MGIFGAMSTAVAGLRAQGYAIENISGNIANSQTTGFKRVETGFVDLIPDAPPLRQNSGSVYAYSRATNQVQGDIRDSPITTFMAINGQGMFVVDDQVATSDSRPIFSGVDKFTRRGDFQMDRFGHLRNGAGYYLKGLPVDAATGNPSASVPEVIRITTDFQAARATTQINYRANLSQLPRTPDYNAQTPNSELLDPSVFNNDPRVSGAGFVRADDSGDFLENSIEGGGVTLYDPAGAPVNVQFRWAKTTNTIGSETWNMYYLENSQATGAAPMWRAVPQAYTFNAAGQMNPQVPSTTIPNLTVNGRNLGNIVLQHGNNGLTQFQDPNGNAQLTELDQNGYPAGELASVQINDGGAVVGTYTNGRSQRLAQVVLASFNGIDRLRRLDGGTFAATEDSGISVLGATGGIQGGALESSNTDIADEFTKLIVTQQAYTANTRVVSTSDDMLREALNMIR
jgi:flagellar hook protein FlgE